MEIQSVQNFKRLGTSISILDLKDSTVMQVLLFFLFRQDFLFCAALDTSSVSYFRGKISEQDSKYLSHEFCALPDLPAAKRHQTTMAFCMSWSCCRRWITLLLYTLGMGLSGYALFVEINVHKDPENYR